MFEIKKILVPTDFSDNASAAYHSAQQIASHYGAKIDFIHIIPMIHYLNASMADLGVPLSMEQDIYPKIQKQSSARLKKLLDEHINDESKGEGIVQIAPRPSRAIADYAKKKGYDLIVMAAKGQHESMLLKGSTTEKVIRYSHIPVLSTDQSRLDNIKNILVPTDGSQISLKALPLAVSMALTFNAEITLFHVQELYAVLSEKVLKDPSKTDEENLRNAIYAELETFFADSWNQVELRRGDDFESQLVYQEGASSKTINVNTVILKRISAHNTITEYAGEHADIIVMTTHGRSGLAHLLLGSTAEKVSQHSESPVLTVKPDFEEGK